MSFYHTIKAIAARSQDTLVQDAAGAAGHTCLSKEGTGTQTSNVMRTSKYVRFTLPSRFQPAPLQVPQCTGCIRKCLFHAG